MRPDPRLSLIFTRRAKIQFALAFVGSVAVAMLEVAGVMATLPLMLLLAGGTTATEPLRTLSTLVGDPPPDQFAVMLAVLIFLAFSLKAVFTILFRWWMSKMVARQQVETSVGILRYYIRMPYINHVERGTSDLIARAGDVVARFYNQVVMAILNVATETITILMITTGLILAAPGPTLALIAYFALVAGGFQWVLRRRVSHLGEEFTELAVEGYRTSFQIFHGIKEIKLRGSADWFIEQSRIARQRMTDNLRLSNLYGELPKYVLELVFITGIAVATVLIFASSNAQEGIGILAMFVAAGFRILPSATRMMAGLNAVRVGKPSIEMVLSEVELAAAYEQDAKDAEHQDPDILSYTKELTLEHLAFRYPTSDADVLSDINLTIPRGTTVGFVGGSGAGKTTLIDLVLGLHEPTSGRILVDGVEIAAHLRTWQQRLSMVPQDVYLIDGTLRQNIAFGEDPSTIDDARIEETIQMAQLAQIIADLPAGLDSEVGERGGRLSGGQRQRIGIARALYRNPQLLVLDEATSALDNLTEHRISSTIAGLSGNTTVLIVAHRLSTVRNCDQVVYMSEGKIEASGTFDEVRRASPEFAHLVKLGSLEPASLDTA
ncbi:MAG: ABC transporter ATP-binding protein [Beutenbergiaceae bacterium]